VVFPLLWFFIAKVPNFFNGKNLQDYVLLKQNYHSMRDIILQNLREAKAVLEKFINNPSSIAAIEDASGIMAESVSNGGKLISCGNGGSMCDAMHFAQELTGRFRHERPSLPALSISDPSHLTCAGNDYGFEHIFSRFVEGMGSGGDVLFAISTSGNSMNVIKAAEAARQKGMKVIALTGKTGGLLSAISDVEIRVEGEKYSDRIQEVHIKVIHILIDLIERKVFS
jgi:D-sedoheptulose 7-phosphate isomerase